MLYLMIISEQCLSIYEVLIHKLEKIHRVALHFKTMTFTHNLDITNSIDIYASSRQGSPIENKSRLHPVVSFL